MDAFIIFALACFVLYVQAGIYALWRNPHAGITQWFLIHILLFAIWSLSFVFSGMGDAAKMLFDPKVILVTGMLLTPAFFVRIYTSFFRKPESQFLRNALFLVLFFLGLIILIYLLSSGEMYKPGRFSVFDDIFFVSMVLAMLFVLNVEMFVQLYARVLRPKAWSHDIIQGIRQIIIICDRDLTVNYVNQYTLEVLKTTMDDINGKQISDVFAESSDINHKAILAMKDNLPGPVSCLLNSPGASPIPVRIEIIKITDDYQDTYGLAIIGEDMRKIKSLNDIIASHEKDTSELSVSTNELELLVKEFSVRLANLNNELHEKHQMAQVVEEQVLEDHSEREWLAYEIHNRVIDNMVLIATIVKSHGLTNTEGRDRKKLDDLSGRIHAILLIHKFLDFSTSYSVVDFKEFVHQLVSEQLENYGLTGKLAVRLHLSEFFLDVERAIPLGLIMHELLSNAIVHAFDFQTHNGSIANPALAGKYTEDSDAFIMIEYVERAEEIVFVFQDNGKGIPPAYKSDDFRANGLVLVDVLVKDQLGGALDFDLSEGTRVMITIPKNALMQGR